MGIFGPPDIGRLKAGRNVKGLLKVVMKHTDAGVRARAIEALGDLGDPGAVETVLEKFHAGGGSERAAAVEALAKIGSAPALGALLDKLKSEHIDKRFCERIVTCLAGTGDERVLEALAEAIRRPSLAWSVKTKAIESLGDFGPSAAEPLLDILRGMNHINLCSAAMAGLERCGWQPDNGSDGAVYYLFKQDWERCVQIGPSAVGPLAKALGNRRLERAMREGAANALARIDDPRAHGPLVGRLVNVRDLDDVDLAGIAVRALERTDWRPGNDDEAAAWYVWKKEWKKCAEVPGPAVQLIFRLLRIARSEKNLEARPWDFERELQSGLVLMGLPARDPLIELLRQPGSTEAERSTAALALGGIGDATAVEPLLDELEKGNASAAYALGKIGDPQAMGPLMDALGVREVCSSAAEALAGLGDPGAVEPILEALRKRSCPERERCSLLGAVRRLGGEAALAEFKMEYRDWLDKHADIEYNTFGSPADL